MKPVLLDTGVIVGLLDRGERLHRACAGAVQELKAPLITCEAVIAESCYLLRNLRGAPEAVIENIAAGIFQIPFQLSRESTCVKHALRKYGGRVWDGRDIDTGPRFRDLPLGKEQDFSNVPRSELTGEK